jgi:CubicO group peptidase (beta-lactamase class C family)
MKTHHEQTSRKISPGQQQRNDMDNLIMIKKSLPKSVMLVSTLLLLLSSVIPAMAEENRVVVEKNVPILSTKGQGPTDPAEMEAFLDDLITREMEKNHIVGAAVSVVKDGRLFFAKGYGYGDLEHKVPVDPKRTSFKIGSVTKLFTWTAVMQLAEQGKLNLDVDINTYLDFHIPDTYQQPITLKHLMTHTAGFEDLHMDMVTLSEEDNTPQGTWLASHIPARVRPPGEAAAYSNYGAALAGYIVARVSGETYSQYIQEHIFNPLSMKSSTVQGLTPSDWRARESVGYTYKNGTFQVFPRLYGPADLFPIGAIDASVTDIARFMIAHLQDGNYSDADITEAHIMEETTARQMHSTLFTLDSRLMGTTYGFFDFSDNGQRTIGHSGEAEPMESLLLLLPDQNLGIFVVYNSLGANGLTRQHFGFQRVFFDHYYPAPPVNPIQPPTDFAELADRFVGAYRMTQNAYTTLEKYLALVGPTVYVKNPNDGTLLLVTPYGDWRIVEEEPLYFRQVDGSFHFVFREDDQGHIAYLFTDFTPMMGFEKLQWYETLAFNMPLLLVSLLIFLSMFPVALIHAIRNRHLNEDQKSAPRGARVAFRLVVGISVLNLLFVIGNVIWGEQLVFGIPFIYKVVLSLGVLSALLTVGSLIYVVLAWKNSYWGVAFRAYYTLVMVAAFAFIWFLNFWNLLGWRY